MSLYSHLSSPTLPRLIQARANATIPFSQTTQTFLDLSSPPPPLPPPRSIVDVSPTTSSPSLYSRVGHSPRLQMARASRRLRALSESDGSDGDDDRRMSMVGGPKVRKYTQVPWEEDREPQQDVETGGPTIVGSADMFSGFSKHATRTNGASVSERRSRDHSLTSTVTSSDSSIMETSSTRRGLAQTLGVNHGHHQGGIKHLLPSASGVSLASNQTASTTNSDDRSAPITPKLRSDAQQDGSPTVMVSFSKKPYMSTGYESSDMSLLPAMLPRSNTNEKPAPTVDHSLTLSPAQGFTAQDRPLMSSGSPGFGLISLEAAQQRERIRSQTRSTATSSVAIAPPTPRTRAETCNHHPAKQAQKVNQTRRPVTTYNIPAIPADPPLNPLHPTTSCASAPSSPPNKIRGRKSGIMRLFNKSEKTQVPPLPSLLGGSATPASRGRDSTWSEDMTSFPLPGESAVRPPKSSRKPAPADASATEYLEPTGLVIAKPQLELRPVSMTFARGLPAYYLSAAGACPESPSLPSAIPRGTKVDGQTLPEDMAKRLKEQILNAKKGWRVQLCELEAQIRELKDELEESRQAAMDKINGGACHSCGCSCGGGQHAGSLSVSGEYSSRRLIDRARVKTAGARGVFGSGSLYEWE